MARTNLDHAREYAALDWRVLPLFPVHEGMCACPKGASCPSPGKHPMCDNGVHDATTTPGWVTHPDANVGIACGEVSGVVVLDIDPRNGGHESLRRLIRKHDYLPHTPTVRTGGGGLHFYFQYPPAGIKKGVLADGIDLVSDGGYVVAPPSNHVDGLYTWEKPHDNWTPLARLPGWVWDELGKRKTSFSIPSSDELRHISSGERNNTLIRIAGAMRRWGLSGEAINAALQVHNLEACVPPLPEGEVERVAYSASRYDPEVGHGEDEQEEGSGISVQGG